MSGARVAFSWPLYGLQQGLSVLGCALLPSLYRPLLFIPISLIGYYLVFQSTTGNTAVDVGMGGAILSQTAFMFDYLVLTNIQKELHRVGEIPGRISFAPFKARLSWAWHLYTSPRGVGWGHEIPQISKISPQNRKAFVLSRLCEMSLCIALQAIFMYLNAINPALTPGAPKLFDQTIFLRVSSAAGLALAAFAQMNTLHCIASIALVGTGISQPADWPPLFGSFKNLYSVQSVWRNSWHSLLRRPLLTITNFIVHDVLYVPLSAKSNYIVGLLKVHTAFFISALIHAGGEFMMLGRGGSGAFFFFALQAWAISLESIVIYLATGSPRLNPQNGCPALSWRLLGYTWVLCWCILVVPLMQQPMIDAGVFVI